MSPSLLLFVLGDPSGGSKALGALVSLFLLSLTVAAEGPQQAGLNPKSRIRRLVWPCLLGRRYADFSSVFLKSLNSERLLLASTLKVMDSVDHTLGTPEKEGTAIIVWAG